MINKINFTGGVYITPSVMASEVPPKMKEIRRIEAYSKEYDVDVFVYSKTEYADDIGSYEAAVAKNGRVWLKTFDMKHPTRSYLKEIPGQQIPKHDIAGFLDGKYDLKKVNEEIVFGQIDIVG